MAASLKLKRGRGFIEANVGPSDALALMGAAYLLSARACVILGRARGRRVARLVPVGSETTASLARDFAAIFENQRARWTQARAALAVVSAAAAAGEAAPGDRTPGLSPERLVEIARLLAETGPDSEERRDPLRIRTSWEDLA